MYYARIKKAGKEIRQSLETTDRALAKRRLADKHWELTRIDPFADRLTLRQLCDRYLQTVQHQKPATVYRKENIVRRIKADWPGGVEIQAGKVGPSQVRT